MLTAIAEVVRNEMAQTTQPEGDIVSNRLNRRKIDVIPLPEWADPPKAEIGALRQVVEQLLPPSRCGPLPELVHRAASRSRHSGHIECCRMSRRRLFRRRPQAAPNNVAT